MLRVGSAGVRSDRPTDDDVRNHLETLISAAEGEIIADTAKRWGCSTRAVVKRRQAAMKWLGAKSMCHAIYLACRRGLLH